MMLTDAITKMKLPPEAATTFAALFTPLRFGAKQHLVLQGESGDPFVYVEAGILRAYYANAQGKQVTKVFFQQGSFGACYGAMLTGQASHQALQALTACQVQVASYQKFKALWKVHPALESLGREMTERIYLRKEQREAELTLMNARQRYERFALQQPELVQQIPQHVIASYLNITPAQLSRIRGQR